MATIVFNTITLPTMEIPLNANVMSLMWITDNPNNGPMTKSLDREN